MTDSRLTETLLTRQVVHSGKIFQTESWTVRLSDGNTAPRQVAVMHCPAAAVVAIDDDGQVMLVLQHRIAVDRLTL